MDVEKIKIRRRNRLRHHRGESSKEIELDSICQGGGVV
jgi:hypothetical protein